MGTVGAAALFYGVTSGTSGPPEREGPIETVTIATLRGNADQLVDGSMYYVTDSGQEGMFRYDAANSSSLDDTGVILVSTVSGARFKRIYDGTVNVKWFGAKGDGLNDDTLFLQAAIDHVKSRGSAYFPPGTYVISSPLTLYNTEVFGYYDRTTKLLASPTFVGYHMLRNWKDSDYKTEEVDRSVAPQKTQQLSYFPHIRGLMIHANKVAGVNHIGWVHFQEGGWMQDLILQGPNESIGIDLFTNTDTLGSFNGSCCIENVVFYGTGWKTAIKGGSRGSDITIRNVTTSPSPHSSSVFDFQFVHHVNFFSMHIEGTVQPSALVDEAIIRIRDCKGFSFINGIFSTMGTLNHPFIYTSNMRNTSYGITSPFINALSISKRNQTDSFTVPFIKDRSQLGNHKDIMYVGQSMIYYYDGNQLSQLIGTGKSELELRNVTHLQFGQVVFGEVEAPTSFDSTHPLVIPYKLLVGNHAVEIRISGRTVETGKPFYCRLILANADNSAGYTPSFGVISEKYNEPGSLLLVYDEATGYYSLHTEGGSVHNLTASILGNSSISSGM